jgi:hypothetical protein
MTTTPREFQEASKRVIVLVMLYMDDDTRKQALEELMTLDVGQLRLTLISTMSWLEQTLVSWAKESLETAGVGASPEAVADLARHTVRTMALVTAEHYNDGGAGAIRRQRQADDG